MRSFVSSGGRRESGDKVSLQGLRRGGPSVNFVGLCARADLCLPPRSLHLPQGHCREDSPPRSCHTTYPLSSWAPPGSRLHSLSARSSQNQQPSLSALMTRAKRITLRLTGSLAGSAKCFCRMKASPWEWAAVSSVWRDGGSTAVSK